MGYKNPNGTRGYDEHPRPIYEGFFTSRIPALFFKCMLVTSEYTLELFYIMFTLGFETATFGPFQDIPGLFFLVTKM